MKTNSYGKVSTQRGDEYQEVYLGLNYYLYGNHLKIQTGWDYVWMKDSAGVGDLGGISPPQYAVCKESGV